MKDGKKDDPRHALVNKQYIAGIMKPKEIKQLKHKYQDKIDIFCGLEFDMYSKVDIHGYDYLIGSVHYLDFNGEKIGFDRGVDDVKKIL